ncbi:universal stress protein [Actinokineospora soli]|uniref:Universal stress protein n=1 Tax=Actinokineospora soli TaxID=1048753 RepID=A0ABW2TQD5_9PSEU
MPGGRGPRRARRPRSRGARRRRHRRVGGGHRVRVRGGRAPRDRGDRRPHLARRRVRGRLAEPAPSSDRPAITASERADLIDRLDPWTDRYPAVAVERVVVCDRPVRALVDRAAGAVLVVVGARGTGGFAGMGLGSTSLALLHQAPCPVAVVRPG